MKLIDVLDERAVSRWLYQQADTAPRLVLVSPYVTEPALRRLTKVLSRPNSKLCLTIVTTIDPEAALRGFLALEALHDLLSQQVVGGKRVDVRDLPNLHAKAYIRLDEYGNPRQAVIGSANLTGAPVKPPRKKTPKNRGNAEPNARDRKIELAVRVLGANAELVHARYRQKIEVPSRPVTREELQRHIASIEEWRLLARHRELSLGRYALTDFSMGVGCAAAGEYARMLNVLKVVSSSKVLEELTSEQLGVAKPKLALRFLRHMGLIGFKETRKKLRVQLTEEGRRLAGKQAIAEEFLCRFFERVPHAVDVARVVLSSFKDTRQSSEVVKKKVTKNGVLPERVKEILQWMASMGLVHDELSGRTKLFWRGELPWPTSLKVIINGKA